MCEFSDKLYNMGVQEGMERGVQEGMERGARDSLLQSVRSLMETVGWSAQQALDCLKVPEEEQARYLAML